MRMSIFGLAALAWFALGATTCFAHDGTITVTGSIVNKTCTVSSDSTVLLVTFGSVSRKTFARAGDGTRYEPFTVNLENCGAGASHVTVTFNGEVDSHDPSLLAIEQGDAGASGVGIALYDREKNLIPMNSPGGGTDLVPNQASVALLFYARYLANGDAVSAGPARASATFTLNYA